LNPFDNSPKILTLNALFGNNIVDYNFIFLNFNLDLSKAKCLSIIEFVNAYTRQTVP